MSDSSSPNDLSIWDVVLLYEEPTYALHTGVRRTYRRDFRFEAPTAEVAARRAQAQFQADVRSSPVSWAHRLVSVEAYPEGKAPPPSEVPGPVAEETSPEP